MTGTVRSFILAVVLSAIGCTDSAPQKHEDAPHADTLWLFAARPTNDAIHATDTEQSLGLRFGVQNVTPAWLQNGEGDSTLGTELFAHDPARRIAIRWTDSLGRRRPDIAEIIGRHSQWHVFPATALGTPLADLERLNGRSFDLLGFDWDYPGGVTDWHGGHLDSIWGLRPEGYHAVEVILAPDGTSQTALAEQVAGDHAFPSDFAPMRAVHPRVYRLRVRVR